MNNSYRTQKAKVSQNKLYEVQNRLKAYEPATTLLMTTFCKLKQSREGDF